MTQLLTVHVCVLVLHHLYVCYYYIICLVYHTYTCYISEFSIDLNNSTVFFFLPSFYSPSLPSTRALQQVGYAVTTYHQDDSKHTPVIGFDMGGTSTDVSRYDGEYEHVFESTTAGVSIQAPQVGSRRVSSSPSLLHLSSISSISPSFYLSLLLLSLLLSLPLLLFLLLLSLLLLSLLLSLLLLSLLLLSLLLLSLLLLALLLLFPL